MGGTVTGVAAKPHPRELSLDTTLPQPMRDKLASFEKLSWADKIKTIRASPQFATATAAEKKSFDWLIEESQLTPSANYWLEWVFVAVNTPVEKNLTSSELLDEMKAGAKVAKPPAPAPSMAARKWTIGRNEIQPTKHFLIDKRNPLDIVIKVKVHVTGSADNVKMIKKLEGEIERHIARTGFTVDLEFTDKPGDDVYEVGCDPSKWAEATNWVGNGQTLGHELCHLLGLWDEYDRLDHATNTYLSVGERLLEVYGAFRQEKKPGGGIMEASGNKILHREITEIAGKMPRLEQAISDTLGFALRPDPTKKP